MYHREGTVYSLAHSSTYMATPYALVRTDAAGRARIPATARVHWPWPLESHPRLIVDFVYSRTVHNGLANLRAGDGSRLGAFEALANHVRLADVSNDPALWHESLSNGTFFLPQVIGALGVPVPDPGAPPVARQLLGDLTEDYAAFLQRYGSTARPQPEMPAYARSGTEDDRRRWREKVGQDLALEPTWGQVADREVGRSLRTYGRR
jgi:hypothetical protein